MDNNVVVIQIELLDTSEPILHDQQDLNDDALKDPENDCDYDQFRRDQLGL